MNTRYGGGRGRGVEVTAVEDVLVAMAMGLLALGVVMVDKLTPIVMSFTILTMEDIVIL